MKHCILFFFLSGVCNFSFADSKELLRSSDNNKNNSLEAKMQFRKCQPASHGWPAGQAGMRNQSVKFLENKGQFCDMDGKAVPDVLFRTSVKGIDVFITTKGITYVFKKSEEAEKENQEPSTLNLIPGRKDSLGETSPKKPSRTNYEWCRMDVNLKGAFIQKENSVTEEPIEGGYFNYYLAHCPQGVRDVRSFEKITFKNIYHSIDWVLYSDGTSLKYDFVVHPGADPSQISMIYEGADKLAAHKKGSVITLETSMGTLQEGALFCYESGSNKQVASRFRISGNEVKFETGTYDVTQSLIIDPPVSALKWATYFGGSTEDDGPNFITMDNTGNLYVTGYVRSTNMPVTNNGTGYFKGTNSGKVDVFITKFNPAGVMLWSTYYGGSQSEIGVGMVTDQAGNLYVVGGTDSPDFPLQDMGSGAIWQPVFGGSNDAFILKFDNAGIRQWATYYGGANYDSGLGIVYDPASGNLYVTGATRSTDFPTQNLAGAYNQPALAGGKNTDIFMLRFTGAGLRQWATYCGGIKNDVPGNTANGGIGNCIASDASGNIYIVGHTDSTGFPTQTHGAGSYLQSAFAGGWYDAIILKFNNAGAMQWSTLYGGSGRDIAHAVTTDATGNVYVTGFTGSGNFPRQNPGGGAYYQTNYGGGNNDAFLLKFNNSGVRQAAMYYGGAGIDAGNDLVIDKYGNLFVTGLTVSLNFPVQSGGCGYYKSTYSGGIGGSTEGDVFITQFDASGNLVWSTYYGGNLKDFGMGMVVDTAGCLYITGEFISTSGITTLDPGAGAYYQPNNSGADDGFMLKFCPAPIPAPISVTAPAKGICKGDSAILTASGAATYLWSPSTGLNTTAANPVTSGAGSTTTYTVTGTDASGCTTTTTVMLTVNALPMVDAGPNATIYNGQSTSLAVTGGTGYSWSPPALGLSCTDCANPVATPSVTTTYYVMVTDSNGCVNMDSVTVFVEMSPCGILFIPNAFSPNGDGENDELKIYYGNDLCIKSLQMTIYDRWAEKVFVTKDPEFTWNGSYKSKTLNTAVFVYYLEVALITGETITKKGNVSLIR